MFVQMWGVSICIIPLPVFVSFHCEYLYYSIASVWCIYQLFRAKESPSAARDGAQLYYIGKHNSASVTLKNIANNTKQKGNNLLCVLFRMAQLCLSDPLKTLSFIVVAFIASILFFATFTAFFSILDME